MRKQLCTYIIMLFCHVAFSQLTHYNFEHIATKEGLSNARILSMGQDKQGFMWFATADGLNRYDGYEFKVFKPDKSDTCSIIDNIPRSLYFSEDGSVIVGSYDALSIYHPEKERFTNITHYTKDTFLKTSPIEIVGKGDDIWFVDRNHGLININIKTQEYKLISECKLPKKDRFVHAKIFLDSKDNLWIGLNDYLVFYSLNKSRSAFHIYSKENSAIVDGFIFGICEDKDGNIWFANDNDFCLIKDFDKDSLVIERKKPKNCDGIVNEIIVGPKNNLWAIIGSHCLARWNPNVPNADCFYVNSDDPTGLKGELRFIFADQQEMIWIGTYFSGLFNFDPFHERIQLIKQIPHDKNSVSATHITGLYEDKNHVIWIGTQEDGYDRLFPDNTFMQFEPNHYGANSCNETAHDFLEDSQGNFWMGTCKLEKISLSNDSKRILNVETFEKANDNDQTLSGWHITKIIESEDDTFYIGSRGGLSKMYYKDGQYHFERYNKNPKYGKTIAIHPIWDMLLDGDFLWVGMDYGLSKLNIKTGAITKYSNRKEDPNSISYNNIKCIHKDQKGNIWIATEGVGINKYIPEIDGFKNYSESDGLIHNVIWGILEDDYGNLWLNTDKGISKFNPNDENFQNFPINSNALYDHWGMKGFLKGHDGKMYFPVNNGLAIFHPDSMSCDNRLAPVTFTSFFIYNQPVPIGKKVNGQVVLENSISLTKELHLNWQNNAFSIEFSTLNYKSPLEKKYAYTLEGFNQPEEWVYADAYKRYAAYSNLKPGMYTFKVKATNAEGVWDHNFTFINIHILPPFWLTWWFKISVLLIIAASITGFYLWKMRSMRHRQNMLKTLVKKRTFEIEKQNIELKSQKEEIETQSEELLATMDELHNANLELEKVNATKDKFFSIIAHDLKNPFHAISGFSSLLNKSYDVINDVKKKEFISMIEKSSKNASNLLENLLTWSRTQTNSVDFCPETVSLLKIINNTFGLLEVAAQKKKISLLSEITEKDLVFVDENMITTVIRNLTSNALKFTNEGGKIIFKSEMIGNELCISIEDTGVGMTSEVVENLFKIDQANSTAGTSGESGTGLGLFICKEFVDKNNGKIEVESKVGKGSKFMIYLPTQ